MGAAGDREGQRAVAADVERGLGVLVRRAEDDEVAGSEAEGLGIFPGAPGGGARSGRQLRRPAVVVVQEAAQTFTTCHRRAIVGPRHGWWRRRDQLAVEALMVALEVVGLDKLGDGEAEMPPRRSTR